MASSDDAGPSSATSSLSHSEWEQLYQLANRHYLVSLLDDYLEIETELQPPDEIRAAISDGARTTHYRNLELAGEMHSVVGALRDADVRVLPFKGPVVAEVCYEDLGSRPFSDVDLLVPPADLPETTSILQEQGYRLDTYLGPHSIEEIPRRPETSLFPFPGELTYVHEERDVEVELRFTHGDRYSDARLDVADLWENRTRVSVAGRECPALSPTDRLVVLTNHGSKHAWRRLESLAGVAGAANRTGADWHEARDRARERGTLRELYLGVLLTVEFFDAGIPEEIEREASADERAAAVAETIRERYATEPMRALSEFERQRVLGRLRGDRATRYVRYVTDPTAGDYQFVNLPEPLWPLYRVVRPIRGTLKALRS